MALNYFLKKIKRGDLQFDYSKSVGFKNLPLDPISKPSTYSWFKKFWIGHKNTIKFSVLLIIIIFLEFNFLPDLSKSIFNELDPQLVTMTVVTVTAVIVAEFYRKHNDSDEK